MLTPALILFLIATILGVWSASLFWRAWHAGRLHRIERRKDPTAIPVLAPGRRRFGILLGWIALPMAGVAFALGEIVRTGSAEVDVAPLDLAIRAGVGVMVCLAIGAAVVAVRFDPPHGRRRCGRCWYDMSATVGRRCPECGHEATGERALFRTRRAPRLVGVAALMLIGAYGLGVVRGVNANGWVAAMPTTAMIIAMPWLSDKAVEGGDASLAGRSWNEEMWGWQRRFLLRRCRRVIETTSDADQVTRAALLWSVVDTGHERPPRLTVDAQISALRAFEAEAKAPGGMIPRILYVQPMFPDMLDPRVAPVAASSLPAAIRSNRPVFVQVGIQLSRLAGPEGEALVPDLTSIVENGAVPQWTSTLAQTTLAQLATSSEGAWEAYLRTFSSTREPIRFHAPSCIEPVIGKDNARLRAALVNALADPSERVKASAASAIVRLGDSLCEWRSSIAELGRNQPALAYELIEGLASECPDAELVPAIEALLRDDHQLRQDAGIRAAGSLGASGAPLLQLLRDLADIEGGVERSKIILDSIAAIERAMKNDAR